MRRWIHSRLWIYFSFLILVISLIIAIGFIILLAILEYFDLLSIFDSFPFLRWLIPIIVSSIIGVSLSMIVSYFILQPIGQLKSAMNKVIESDFGIQLAEEHPIEEVTDLYRSFNLLVRELKRIEHFQNDFTSMVSHEFKTPLSRIQGYAQLLNHTDLDPHTRQVYQDDIISASKELTQLTDNILSLAKLDNQNLNVDKTQVSLDEQIREAILRFQRHWEDKDLQLQIFLEPIHYLGNANLLMQVWTNLIDNAIYYSPQGGPLEIYLQDKDGFIVFTIKDHGPGILPQHQPHIFEKFYQGDASRNKSGSGLGLSITKRIVELHHGKIYCQSQPGQGTTFIVEFPSL